MSNTTNGFIVAALSFALTALQGCLVSGCSQDTSFEQKMAAVDQLAQIAKEHNLAGSVSVDLSGDGSLYSKQSFGADLGAQVKATFLFNSGGASTTDEVIPDES